jgi:hypothetical protein
VSTILLAGEKHKTQQIARDTAITNIIMSRKGTHKHTYMERGMIKAMAEDQP